MTPADEIIEKIEASYAKIVRLYRSVPVNTLLEPTLSNGWSVKDLLGHLAMWEWRCAGLLEQAHHSDLPLKAEPDVDALNREAYQERQELEWEEVEQDFRQAHAVLLTNIRAMPAERLQTQFVQDSIAGETWHHYEEHLPALEAWHKQVATQKPRRR
ncbi:MAG: maleylpyruvate isomerase N-terminal domain-containing protein [Chloroflexota bacterium]